MKAVIAYGLIVFYFLISIGLTTNIHYCGGKLKSISFIGFGEQKSCCKAKAKKRSCCEDVRFAFKKNGEDQRVLEATFMLAHTVEVPYEHHVYLTVREYFVPREIVPTAKAPPPDVFPPLIIRNCVFRI